MVDTTQKNVSVWNLQQHNDIFSLFPVPIRTLFHSRFDELYCLFMTRCLLQFMFLFDVSLLPFEK